MTETEATNSKKVTEDDALVQTPNGERYPAAEIDQTGETTPEE